MTKTAPNTDTDRRISIYAVTTFILYIVFSIINIIAKQIVLLFLQIHFSDEVVKYAASWKTFIFNYNNKHNPSFSLLKCEINSFTDLVN